MDSNFYLIDKRALPDVYEKVVKAKKLLKDKLIKQYLIQLFYHCFYFQYTLILVPKLE